MIERIELREMAMQEIKLDDQMEEEMKNFQIHQFLVKYLII